MQIQVRNSESEVPSTELERIFDKFYRVPQGDRWQYGGTGLGLTLVKQMVVDLQGVIEVSSHKD
ncbi:MAG: sensor histidine kinase [Synechococcales cyanobacterium T60_A2020_003]|nr:sensor histidine kinase [Synechococcales cyanobacterium T60_A2020_003]